MPYSVKEIYYTLQGEGAQTGRAAVFCRFAGCNLWSGSERDRLSALCQFCDTDFVGTDGPGGGIFADAAALTRAIAFAWQGTTRHRFVVCTGGEPLLQLDNNLCMALHREGFSIAVETNGTLPPPPGIDWLCVSPKAGVPAIVRGGNECKIVYPQEGMDPALWEQLEFDHFFIQPMDGPEREKNTRLAIEYCLAHPRWKLSLQSHKYIGLH
jgi:7-carboxy-7-deazaguanine synthase (Cx14CxxC type)